jgi:uncharacterized protein YndB with AHSA1/START domain
MNDPMPVAAADQQILITRIFDAPRERVFKAWTDPDQVAAWYGPAHFDTPRDRIHIDLRVGGRYELTMVQRDGGAEFGIGYEIVELVEPELIVLRSDPMPEVGMHDPTITRVEFHDHGAFIADDTQRRALPRWPRPRRGRVDRCLRQPRGVCRQIRTPAARPRISRRSCSAYIGEEP